MHSGLNRHIRVRLRATISLRNASLNLFVCSCLVQPCCPKARYLPSRWSWHPSAKESEGGEGRCGGPSCLSAWRSGRYLQHIVSGHSKSNRRGGWANTLECMVIVLCTSFVTQLEIGVFEIPSVEAIEEEVCWERGRVWKSSVTFIIVSIRLFNGTRNSQRLVSVEHKIADDVWWWVGYHVHQSKIW